MVLDLHIDLYICNFSLKFHCCRMESLAGVACIGHFILVTCVLLVLFCNLVLLSLWRTPRAAHLLTLYPVQYHRPMEILLMQVVFFCSRKWLSPILSTALILTPSWQYVFRACFMKSFVLFFLILVATEVFSWGSGTNYQLGTGNAHIQKLPCKVDTLHGSYIKTVAASKFHSVAVSSDGELYTWGFGRGGRLGHPDIHR